MLATLDGAGGAPPAKARRSRAGVARLRRHLRERARAGRSADARARQSHPGRRRAAAVPRPRAGLGARRPAGDRADRRGARAHLPAGPPPPSPRGRQARRADAHDARVAQAGQGPALRRRNAATRRARLVGPSRSCRGKRRKQANAEARWIARVAGRADELGELLGEEHDLAVLRGLAAEQGRAAGVGRGTRRALRKLIVAPAAQAPPPRAARGTAPVPAQAAARSCGASRARYERQLGASADAEDRERAGAARQRHRRLLAGGPAEQRRGDRRFGRQPALAAAPRRGS